MKRFAAVVLAVAMLPATPAFTQSAQNGSNDNGDSAPVSLRRIKRGLQEAQSQPTSNRLKLSYYVAVVGESGKPINLFKDFDPVHGAVPFTAPSHQELFEHVTPQEFRAPPADILGAAVWLGSKLARKAVDNQKK